MAKLSIPETAAHEVKRTLVRVALEASGWSIAAAARALRMSRQALHYALVPLGLREEYDSQARLTRSADPCTTGDTKKARRRSNVPGRDRGGAR